MKRITPYTFLSLLVLSCCIVGAGVGLIRHDYALLPLYLGLGVLSLIGLRLDR